MPESGKEIRQDIVTRLQAHASVGGAGITVEDERMRKVEDTDCPMVVIDSRSGTLGLKSQGAPVFEHTERVFITCYVMDPGGGADPEARDAALAGARDDLARAVLSALLRSDWYGTVEGVASIGIERRAIAKGSRMASVELELAVVVTDRMLFDDSDLQDFLSIQVKTDVQNDDDPEIDAVVSLDGPP